MKHKKKWLQSIVAVCMAISMIILSIPVPFFADKTTGEIPEDAIYISSGEDLMLLAENCKLDTWSIGKTVVLTNDIDMSECEFEGIPTFGGVFYGKGFTIKGIDFQSDGSVVGFFRYLQKNAVVEQVNFEGTVLPQGSKSIVGAIAGSNAGTISNCTWKGTVAGNEHIGGLVGINETNGVIEDCTIAGVVYGNHFIGGAAGENHGVIRDVTNYAEINTLSVQNTVALEDITLESLLNTENASTTTDIGGIAGSNSGVIRSCENNGLVGYQHMGYNIGGIAGRQSGYIVDCVNHADVQGRKEIGGIAGHVEPNVAIDFSQDGLEKLQQQLNVVEGSMNNLKNNVQKESTEMQQQMAAVEKELSSVQEATDALIEIINVEDTAENIEEATKLLKSIAAHLTKMMSLIEKLSESLEDLDPEIQMEISVLLEQMKTSIENINKSLEALDGGALTTIVTELNTLTNALTELMNKLMPEDTESDDANNPYKKFSDKVTELSKEMEKLETLLNAVNWEEATKTIESIEARLIKIMSIVKEMSALLEGVDTDAFVRLAELMVQIQTALDNISKYLEDPTPEALEKVTEELSKLTASLSEIAKILGDLASNMGEAATKWSELVQEFNTELDALQKDVETLEGIMDALDTAEVGKTLTNITSLLGDLLEIADEISKDAELDAATKAEVEVLMVQIQTSLNKINAALNSIDLSVLSTLVSDLKTLMNTMSALATALEKAYNNIQQVTGDWPTILADLKTETEALQSDMEKLEKILDEMNTDLPDAAINDVGNSMGDLFDALGAMGSTMDASTQNITNALNDVVKQLEGAMGIVDNFDETIQASIQDVSDLDTVENTLGKIADCINQGTISGEYNIGGIVGLMGEESDFSTAEQAVVSGSSSLNMAYQMRAVVRGCRNAGMVLASKQYVGGIVGQMLLGCVLESINQGNIDAIHADHVGGIAGKSDAIIRNSSSKVVLAGNSYVGGIAGEAKEVSDCIAFVKIVAAKENAGAIAGNAKELPNESVDNIKGNIFFIDGKNYGGIDGITYAGATDFVDLATFLQIPDLDSAFSHVTVRFKIEGQADVVKTIGVGESLSLDQIPVFTVEEGEEFDWELVPEVTEKVLAMGEIADVEYISEASLRNILFDQTYQVSFDMKGSVISASDRTENNRSILLAVGSFAKNTILEMKDMLSEETVVYAKPAIVNYEVSFSNSGVKKLHFLLPEGIEFEKVKLFTKDTSGNWTERAFVAEGSYMVFEFTSEDVGFALINSSGSMIGTILVIAVILMIFGCITTLLRRKKKNTNN